MEKVQKLDQSPEHDQLLRSLFNANVIEQYRPRDINRIFGAVEAPGEDPYNTIIQGPSNAGVVISRDDISVCHRLPTKSATKTIIAKLVRKKVKSAIMQCKVVLREKRSKFFLENDITPFQSKLWKVLQDSRDITYVSFLNEKNPILWKQWGGNLQQSLWTT